MSSAVVSTSAALGRPFVFDATHDAHVGTAALGCPVEQGSTATHAAHLPGVARLDSRGRLSPHEPARNAGISYYSRCPIHYQSTIQNSTSEHNSGFAT